MSFRKDILAACTVGDLAWLQRSIAGTSLNLTSIQDKEGRNALHLAVMHGRFDCVKYLLDHCGIDVNEPSSDARSTALHYCVSESSGNSSIQCLKVLLERGANQSTKDADGQTVLHRAAKVGNIKCAKLLLEHGADIDALDGGGNTPHDLAGLYGHHECTRLLRALHWACRKDATARGKIETQVLDRRRERESTALTTRLQKEAASDAYTRWMRNKNLPTNARHKSDSKCKEARTQACGACSALTSQRFGPYNETLTTPIKISHRQEERNIQGVGKPEKLFPYSNYPPRPAVPQRKKPCVAPRSQSAAPNGRTPQRIPHPHSAPPLRTHSSAAAAATSALEICPEVEEVSSRDNQVEEEGEDDDDALFHEVDQMGEFRSSTLPRFINGKQLTQLLQLLSSRTITGTRSTNSLPLSQDRANTRHAKYRSQFHRRFSLGAIPEGQVVESYIKYGAVTCCDTEEESWEAAQGSIDGCEKSIDSDGELNDVVGDPQECANYVPAASGDCNDRSSPQKPSPLSLAIVNFTWDRDRNSVCTEAVSSPLVPHPFPEHQQVRNSGRKATSRRPSTSTSLRTVSRRVCMPKSAPPSRTALNREPPSVLSLGGLASKSMVISDHVSDPQASHVTPNAKCVKPAMFVFGGSLVHT